MKFKGLLIVFIILFSGLQVMPGEHASVVSAEHTGSSESEKEKSSEEEFTLVSNGFKSGHLFYRTRSASSLRYSNPALNVPTEPPRIIL